MKFFKKFYFDNIMSQEETPKPSEEIKDSQDDILQIEKGFVKPFGLKNVGNSCYMNSAFQCLFSLPSFVKNLDNMISESENPKLLVEIKNYILDPLHDPTKIREILGERDEIYKGFLQQDSYLLFVNIIDLLSDENEKMIYDLFYGKLNSDIICKKCNDALKGEQVFSSINLSIVGSRQVIYIPYDITKHSIELARIPKVSETIGFEDESIEKVIIKPFLLLAKMNSKFEFIDHLSTEYNQIYAFELPENVKEGFGLTVVQLKTPENIIFTPPFLCEVPIGQNDENQLKKIILERIKELFPVPTDDSQGVSIDEIESSFKLKRKIESFNFSEKPPFCLEYVTYTVSNKKLLDKKKRSKKPSDEVISIIQLFNGHITKNQLSVGCKLDCDKCHECHRSFQQMKYISFPQILVMHIERGLKTLKKEYSYDSKIFLPQKISVKKDGEFSTLSSIVDESDGCDKYELVAITDHIGNLDYGHYTALAKRGENWYHFNDSNVTQIPEISEPSRTSFTVFYEKINDENNDK